MKSTIENLYYGNITPYDQILQRDSECDKAIKRIVQYEEELNARLQGEEKDLLEKYDDARSNLLTQTACEHWKQGFSLGLKIGMEAVETVERLTV